MIQGVVFDILGVLVESGDNARVQLIKEGFNKENVLFIGGTGSLGQAYFTGTLDYEIYKQKVTELFGSDTEHVLEVYLRRKPLFVSLEKCRKAFENYGVTLAIPENIPDRIHTIDFAKILSEQFPLCLFSGNNPHELDILDEAYHFLQYFTFHVYSFEVGVDKPDIRMFQRLKETVPLPLSDCLYIDDKEVNLTEGNNWGLHGINMHTIDVPEMNGAA